MESAHAGRNDTPGMPGDSARIPEGCQSHNVPGTTALAPRPGCFLVPREPGVSPFAKLRGLTPGYRSSNPFGFARPSH